MIQSILKTIQGKALNSLLLMLFTSTMALAKPFSVLTKKIESNPNLAPKEIKKMAEQECKAFVLSFNYSHFLHLFYLKYEINKRFYKKNDRLYKINTTYYLKNAAKEIDPQMYHTIYDEYIDFISNKNEQLKYYLELNNYCIEHQLTNKTIDNLLSIAFCYYQLNEYSKAIEYWNKCMYVLPYNDHGKKSSVLNNIACSYDEKKSINEAIYFNRLAISELNKITNKNLNETFFYYFLLGNRGTYAKKTGDYTTAYTNFKANYDFYLRHKKYHTYLASVVSELIELNEKFHTPISINIQEIENIYKNIDDINEKIVFNEVLLKYYDHVHNYPKSNFYAKSLINIQKKLTAEKISSLELVNKQLNNDKLLASTQRKALELDVEKKRTNLVFSVIVFLLVILGVVIYFKLITAKRKAKMLLQHNELELARQKAIENELKYQKENNLNLQLNLDIKKKSELVFMDKLKEIKRRKNNDPEEIIKELQLQIINLLQIDKKNNGKVKEITKDENAFKNSLIALNKNLSEQEIRLCTYFKLNLSTKEISQLEQHLAPASIRVLKNRIKKKLELGIEDNLYSYLNDLTHSINKNNLPQIK